MEVYSALHPARKIPRRFEPGVTELAEAWNRYVNSDIKPILMLAERLEKIYREREEKRAGCKK